MAKEKREKYNAISALIKAKDKKRYGQGLMTYCNENLFIQLNSSQNNKIYRTGENTWLVKHNYKSMTLLLTLMLAKPLPIAATY